MEDSRENSLARMQYDLRRILHFLDARVLLKPEVCIAHAATRFDAEGRLTDETTLKFLGEQMRALQRWTVREQVAARAESGCRTEAASGLYGWWPALACLDCA
ncbi:MAG TPA: hypothetical protein VLK85_19400 [Ramlibacter sp.]|nr:hypothetical protein [Ramlibacter sp.]